MRATKCPRGIDSENEVLEELSEFSNTPNTSEGMESEEEDQKTPIKDKGKKAHKELETEERRDPGTYPGMDQGESKNDVPKNVPKGSKTVSEIEQDRTKLEELKQKVITNIAHFRSMARTKQTPRMSKSSQGCGRGACRRW